MTKGLVIRTRELGGKIVTLGDNHARGIVVEQPNFESNDWGPLAGSVVLKRSPRVQWPDLRANAPVRVFDRGSEIWRGRIKQTPQTDGGLARSISVQCEGQQFRLDDDSYERKYVHTKLTEWVDSRSLVNASLAAFTVGGVVQVADGAITLSWPTGIPVLTSTFTGVTLDFGASLCKRVALHYASSNNTGIALLYCRGSDTLDGGVTGTEDAWTPIVNNAGSQGFALGTFANAHRYVYVFLYHNFGATETPAADIWFKIDSIQLFGDAAWEGSSASILKASTVVSDALDRATLQLSADRSLIGATLFNVPELAMSAPSTPREVITGVNVFHDYQMRVRADNRPEYRPRPATPTIEVGADSKFNEASAGDASEIYTTVVVVYTDAAGQQQRLTRNQTSLLQTTSALQPLNPSAAVDTSSWAASYGVLSRDTVVFDTAPASFKITIPLFLPYYIGYVTTNAWTAGTWVAARAYSISGRVRLDNPALIYPVRIVVNDGTTGAYLADYTLPPLAANTWVPFSVPFAPQTAVAPTLTLQFNGAGVSNGWFDSLVLTESAPTIVDQWGFKRSKVLETGMSLTPAGAQQIADTFLLGHRTTPLKGSLIVAGDGRARRSPSGQPMRCSELLESVGDLVRFRHLVDPETGKVGRIGRIASANWDPVTNTTTLEIDSTNKNFEAMLARLAIVTSQVRS